MTLRISIVCAVMLLAAAFPRRADAIGGTSQIASRDQPVRAEPRWPAKLEEFLNQPARGDGWNSWFSEWPNDVRHYELEVSDAAQLDALVAEFAQIKHEHLQIRLSPLAEPRGLGWMTSLPAGNKTAVIFSIGDQERIDDWYGRLPGGRFGRMEFERAPVAVPPTLTIFVGHDAVDLTKLDVPEQIGVSCGYVPTVFWEWNRKNAPAATPCAPPKADATVEAAHKQIEAFLKRRDRAKEAKEDSP